MQFWYTEETAGILAKEVVEAAGPSGRIACIACPSLFRALREKFPDARAHLFEVDLRFEVSYPPLKHLPSQTSPPFASYIAFMLTKTLILQDVIVHGSGNI